MTRALALLIVSAALPSQALTDHSGPYEFQVLVGGVPARTFTHDGETYVLGHLGDRYTLRIVNHTGQRIEAVVSVDGRDVIDGKPADWRGKRGYLVRAWGSVDIEGWRTSQSEVAAFRFSTVPQSYAAKTGTAREVGVIGVAVFPERYVPPPPPIYAPPPRPYEGMRDDMGAPSANEGRSAMPPAAAPLAQKKAERPGLGTEFGEAVSSHVTEVPFERARTRPDALLGARYNDRSGLIALGIDVDGGSVMEADLRRTADPFPIVERRYAQPPPDWHR